MRPGEEAAVLELVLGVFGRCVAPDFSPGGVAEFSRAAREFVLEHPRGHHITVADQGGSIVGMIDLRGGAHVSLLFVDESHQRRGVGAALLSAALERHGGEEAWVTVNAGPSSVPAYLALGFEIRSPEKEVDGIRYVQMRKRMPQGRPRPGPSEGP